MYVESREFVVDSTIIEVTTKFSKSHLLISSQSFTTNSSSVQRKKAAAAALQKYDDLLQSYQDRDDRCDKSKKVIQKEPMNAFLSHRVLFCTRTHSVNLFQQQCFSSPKMMMDDDHIIVVVK